MIRSLVALAAVLAVAVAGCGGGNGSGSGGSAATATPTQTAAASGGKTLSLAAPADGSLRFDKKKLSAPAGTVTIDFDNPSSVPHAVEVEGDGVQQASQTVTGGKTSVTVDLKPGEYTFYCPVGNHRAAGMEGTLKVR